MMLAAALPIPMRSVAVSNVPVRTVCETFTDFFPPRLVNQPRSFLDAHFTIGVIVQKTTVSLYAPRCGTRAFDYIQATILDRSKELAEWKDAALPMQDGKLMNRFGSQRDLTSLRISYWSAKILIGRMCVCRTERRMKGQTPQSAAFNQKTAELVVKAAQEMVDLLPDQPNPKGLYKVTPWWSLVHHRKYGLFCKISQVTFHRSHASNVCVAPRARVRGGPYLGGLGQHSSIHPEARTLVPCNANDRPSCWTSLRPCHQLSSQVPQII
jgi:hypothetical protein